MKTFLKDFLKDFLEDPPFGTFTVVCLAATAYLTVVGISRLLP